MVEILLARPGASEYCEQGRIQGTLDMPLSERGEAEVAALASQLAGRSVEAVCAADCEPALSTGKALAKALDAKFKKLRRLRNLDHGLWQGMLVDEVKLKQPTVYRQWQEQPESIRPPKGETIDEARTRVEECVAKLRKTHKGETIVLVAPEPLASLIREQCGQPLGDLWRAAAEHGTLETLQLGEPAPVGATQQ